MAFFNLNLSIRLHKFYSNNAMTGSWHSINLKAKNDH
jgi:hypothetical protein